MRIKIGLNLFKKTIRHILEILNFWIKFLRYETTNGRNFSSLFASFPRSQPLSTTFQRLLLLLLLFLLRILPSPRIDHSQRAIRFEYSVYIEKHVISRHRFHILCQFDSNSKRQTTNSAARLRDINFRRLMNTHLHFGTKLKEESFECLRFSKWNNLHLLFFFFFCLKIKRMKRNLTTNLKNV